MTREEIDDDICEIMIEHGPDRHVDGHDHLTDYVMQVVAAERERCAKLAEANEDCNAADSSGQACDAGLEIAARIRSGG